MADKLRLLRWSAWRMRRSRSFLQHTELIPTHVVDRVLDEQLGRSEHLDVCSSSRGRPGLEGSSITDMVLELCATQPNTISTLSRRCLQSCVSYRSCVVFQFAPPGYVRARPSV